MNPIQKFSSSHLFPWKTTLFSFLVTRALILIVFVFASALQFKFPVAELGDRIQEPLIILGQPGLAQRVGDKVLVADALWYADIARHGYERREFDATSQHNWAFFPLYPLLLKAAGKITGEYAWTGSLLSNIFFLLALFQLHRLVLKFGYDAQTADRAILYLAAYPTSYFFSLPFTESLFLLLSLSCFLSAKSNSWWLAGLFGGLAAATRVTGLCLFPVMALIYWQQQRTINHKALALLLIPAGIVPYMIFLRHITGNALAFLDVQAAWGHSFGFFLRPLWEYVTHPLEINLGWDFRFLSFLTALLAFACSVFLLKRKEWALATYTLLCIILPLTAMRLQSLTRYSMIAFPIFIALGAVGQSTWADQIIRTVFIFLLGMLTLLFALHFSMAMS